MSLDPATHPVAVLFGGPSGEHDVSVVSGKNIAEGLDRAGFPVVCVAIERRALNGSPQWRRLSLEELGSTSFANPIDVSALGSPINPKELALQVRCAFPICHGPFGEDGELQKQLDQLRLPYVGTGPEGCVLSLDKALSKKEIEKIPLTQTPFMVTKDKALPFTTATAQLKTPLFVKPCAMGSSVGISRVTEESQWQQALDLAFQHDDTIVIEQGIEGRELECAILETEDGLRVSGIAEIVSNHDFYSYEAKYIDPNGASLIYPAKLSLDIEDQLKAKAQLAFTALKCRDYARADFFLSNEGDIVFNEINTHPGFTSISQFPSLWKHMGISFNDLVSQLVSRAIGR